MQCPGCQHESLPKHLAERIDSEGDLTTLSAGG
jgi:hypothetical protein